MHSLPLIVYRLHKPSHCFQSTLFLRSESELTSKCLSFFFKAQFSMEQLVPFSPCLFLPLSISVWRRRKMEQKQNQSLYPQLARVPWRAPPATPVSPTLVPPSPPASLTHPGQRASLDWWPLWGVSRERSLTCFITIHHHTSPSLADQSRWENLYAMVNQQRRQALQVLIPFVISSKICLACLFRSFCL